VAEPPCSEGVQLNPLNLKKSCIYLVYFEPWIPWNFTFTPTKEKKKTQEKENREEHIY
jgi:hypothetical protein